MHEIRQGDQNHTNRDASLNTDALRMTASQKNKNPYARFSYRASQDNLIEEKHRTPETREAEQHLESLTDEIKTTRGHIAHTQKTQRVLEQQKEPLQHLSKYIENLRTNFSKKSPDYRRRKKEYDNILSELEKIHAYNQAKQSDFQRQNESLPQEEKALETRLPELQEQHQQAKKDLQDLQTPRPPELVGDLTQERIKAVHEQVQRQKERLYHVMKAHENFLKKFPSERRNQQAFQNSLRRLQTSHANLKEVEREFEMLQQKASEKPELGLSTTFEGDQHSQLSTLLWDSSRAHYETRRTISRVIERFRDMAKVQKSYQDQPPSPPELAEQATDYSQWNHFALYQERLLAQRDDLVAMGNAYSTIGKALTNQGGRCREAIQKLQAATNPIDAIDTSHTNESLQTTKKELGEIQKALQEANKRMGKLFFDGKNRVPEIREQLNKLNRDVLPDVTEKVNELRKKLSDDHPYFSWYERTEYNAAAEGHQSIKAKLRMDCVVSAILTRIGDYPKEVFDGRKITSKQVADAVRHNPAIGALTSDVPDALRELGVPESYSIVDLNHQDNPFRALKSIVKGGAAIVRLYHKDFGGHVVVLDKIEHDPATKIQYAYMRDSLGGIGEQGTSYKVRASAFQDAWDHKNIISSDTSLSSLPKSMKRHIEILDV